MTLSSLLERSSATTAFPETQRWLQERSGVSVGVFQNHKDQKEKLFACFEALQIQDPEALAFCKTYIEQRTFWLEWEIYGESGTTDSQYQERCAFLSKLVAGRPTAMINLTAH